MSVTACKSAHSEGAPWNAGWFGSGYLCPTSEIRHRGQATTRYGAMLNQLAVDSAGLFFSCQRFAQVCGSSGYFVISGVSWSSHHEKKGRGQPRPRTNWAAIGLVPLHSGKGRTRKETFWVLAGLSVAGGNPAKACTWHGPGEPPPKYPAGSPRRLACSSSQGVWNLHRPTELPRAFDSLFWKGKKEQQKILAVLRTCFQ